MFQWVVGGVVLLGLGAIALHSKFTPVSEKVKKGDSVFVPPSALGPVDPVTGAADASRFLSGFLATSIKVTNVVPISKSEATGSVVGLSPLVKFPLLAVTKIERNGKQFT
jgi:hypothetical protein